MALEARTGMCLLLVFVFGWCRELSSAALAAAVPSTPVSTLQPNREAHSLLFLSSQREATAEEYHIKPRRQSAQNTQTYTHTRARARKQ